MAEPQLTIDAFVSQCLAQNVVVCDVRSEGEYASGHVPGAFNLPLLNNEERHAVGICYKQHGQQAAVRLGFELTGHKFYQYIDRARAMAADRELVIYCWRGGLRSNIMCWLLRTAGVSVRLVEGGYKAWRTRVHNAFATHGRLLLLGGKTGSRKTELLHALAECGAAVVDLEHIARHKGSAFGALGEEETTSQEQFENELGLSLLANANESTVWLEDESRLIGPVRIPDVLYQRMQAAPRIMLDRPYAVRHAFILEEYGKFSRDELRTCTLHLKKRMGYDRVQEAVALLEEGRLAEWLDRLLKYYDAGYDYSFAQLKEVPTQTLAWTNESTADMARALFNLEKEWKRK